MRFSNKDLRRLIIPLIIEQFLTVSVGLADSVMIAAVGEAAMSAVSLVDSVMILFINIFTALAAGGAVVVGQFIGREDTSQANKTSEQLIFFITVFSAVLCIMVYASQNLILYGIFGKIEAEVMSSAKTYLLITAGSIPFIAIYSGGAGGIPGDGQLQNIHENLALYERGKYYGKRYTDL